MSDKCNIIKDLLPLYVEYMVSTDTRKFVSEHLEHCAECRAEFEHMKKPADFIPDTDIVPLKRIKKDLFIKRLQTIFFTAVLACAIAAVVFGILTAPKFFPYSASLLSVIDSPDGNIIIAFDHQVTGYSCVKEHDSETDTDIFHINAWTTTWDLYSSNRGNQNVVIPPEAGTEIQIYYAQNNGSEDVLVYGPNDKAQDVVTLPRQILLPYFLLALLALAVLAILRYLLRSSQTTIVWIDRAVLFPISYMAAQLCTKGINFTTYSSQRDFCIMILVAMLFYFAMLTGKSLYKARKGLT